MARDHLCAEQRAACVRWESAARTLVRADEHTCAQLRRQRCEAAHPSTERSERKRASQQTRCTRGGDRSVGLESTIPSSRPLAAWLVSVSARSALAGPNRPAAARRSARVRRAARHSIYGLLFLKDFSFIKRIVNAARASVVVGTSCRLDVGFNRSHAIKSV